MQRSAVSHWESDVGKNPSVGHLRAIATVTQVQFEWLVTGRGSMQVSVEQALESIAAAEAVLIEDGTEIRLIESFRTLSVGARVVLLELIGMLALPRGRLHRGKATP